MGNCNMPCSGDDKQICGGAGLISIYRKCGSGDCVNAGVPFINGSWTGTAPSKGNLVFFKPASIPTKLTTAGRKLRVKKTVDEGLQADTVA